MIDIYSIKSFNYFLNFKNRVIFVFLRLYATKKYFIYCKEKLLKSTIVEDVVENLLLWGLWKHSSTNVALMCPSSPLWAGFGP